ncbi:CbtA family protein [uncultured Enterovirga sp.]|uniref:CbtA family protein n=1 Tax=uncultured Enterovirga sp. TaxID=2026352 RepID=UPI0035C99FB0
MPVFRSIVFAAAISGLLVGLLVSVLQHLGTVPLIAQGETFEKAPAQPAAGHAHGAGGNGSPAAASVAADEAWEPRPGLERNAYTVLFNIVERIGFSLMLAAALILSGRPLGWREGFLWGLAGFLVFVLAPGIGLPPELPGIPAAPLWPRQIWWVGTALCTGAGLWLILFKRHPAAAILGVALLVAPHLVGAPQIDITGNPVPAALSHRFVVAVFLTTLLSWSLLGALTGYFGRRFLASPQSRTA